MKVRNYILFIFTFCYSVIYSQTTVPFNFTGNVQTWTVPPCVTSIFVTAAGADGGGSAGGNGAVVTGTLSVTPGQVLNIYVGGTGTCNTNSGGGWNGGGTGKAANSNANGSCGGGGATDIRIGGTALSNRVIVASGGGGMGGGTQDAAGGAGGCATGVTGVASFGGGGTGGTQTSGGTGGNPGGSGQNGASGTLGNGAAGATDNCYNNSPGGGGGGGLYGGGSGGADCFSSAPYGGGGGGGGSSLTPAGGGCTQGSNNGPRYLTIAYTGGVGTATATNTGPYCVGTTIQLNSTGGGTYSWAGPNGFTSTSQNPTLTAATAAAGAYTVTVTSTGCTATATTNVVVNSIPVVNAGVNQTVCQGSSVTLSGSGATTYTWSGGVAQGVAFTPPVGTNTYTVTGTSSGCTATDDVLVTVNPIPTVNAGTDQAVCAGTPVTLSASGSALTYSWDNSISDGVQFTPTSTLTYTATGTGTGGCTATDQVQVVVNPIPNVLAGTDQTVCDGASVTLTATGADTYSWDNGAIQGSSFIPATGTVTYTVTGTTLAGCQSSDQMVLTVNPNPTPVILGDLVYCAPTPPTMSTDQAYAGYSWSNGAMTSTIVGDASYNPLTVTVTDGNGCQGTSPAVNLTENSVINTSGSFAVCQGETVLIHGNPESVAGTYSQTFTSYQGCDSVSVITLNVNPLPPVNAGADQAVCEGVSVTLSASGAQTYSWTNGVSNGSVFTPGTTLTYTVSGTDLNGCVNSDDVIVTVNTIPVVDAGPDQTECAGTSVTLTGNGAATYNWSNNVTDGVAFIPLATATYTVTGTSAEGCYDQDQVTVTINPIPNVTAGIDQTVCEGETVTLNGSGANTYTWDNNVVNGVPFAPPVGTTIYTVVGATAAGCTRTDQVTVVVEPAPQVTFVADVTSGCTPLTVNLTNTTANATDCQWTLSNGTMINGCGTVQTVLEQGGCINVTLSTSSTNGCTGSITAQNYICAENPPLASFAPVPQIVSSLEPYTSFNNTTIGAVEYFWDFGDGETSTEENPDHQYEQGATGSYDVMLIAYTPLGCVDTAWSYVDVQEELIYYVPNSFTPDGDIFNQTFKPIFTSGIDIYNYNLTIYNRWGQVVFESKNPEIGWDGSFGEGDNNVGIVQDGVYVWKIKFKMRNYDEFREITGHVTLMR